MLRASNRVQTTSTECTNILPARPGDSEKSKTNDPYRPSTLGPRPYRPSALSALGPIGLIGPRPYRPYRSGRSAP